MVAYFVMFRVFYGTTSIIYIYIYSKMQFSEFHHLNRDVEL
jgi:hypothetical protein